MENNNNICELTKVVNEQLNTFYNVNIVSKIPEEFINEYYDLFTNLSTVWIVELKRQNENKTHFVHACATEQSAIQAGWKFIDLIKKRTGEDSWFMVWPITTGANSKKN